MICSCCSTLVSLLECVSLSQVEDEEDDNTLCHEFSQLFTQLDQNVIVNFRGLILRILNVKSLNDRFVVIVNFIFL